MRLVSATGARRSGSAMFSACARVAASAHVWAAIVVLVATSLWAAQYYLRVAPTQPNPAISLTTPLDSFQADPPVAALEDWTERRAPLLRAAFQADVYGELPAALPPATMASRLIDEKGFDGAGRIEEVSLSLAGPNGAIPIDILLALPVRGSRQAAPVLIIPNFCGNRAAIGYRYGAVSQPEWIAERCRTGFGRFTTELMHGDSIIRLPFEDLLRAGYAVVTFSPGQIVPDDPVLAGPAIRRLPPSVSGGPLVGAVGAWSWSMSRVADFILSDARFDRDHIALFGHSRMGKAALLTAALDPRIDAVIANQSGRLGAAPSSDTIGEPLPSLFKSFPYWFPEQARESAMDQRLDQQYLLALIAPRPLLLGGARLDRWSDPEGAFQTAQSASAAWRLLGRAGLIQTSMQATDLDGDIACYFRSGGHGVRRSDFSTTIGFLNRHFHLAGDGGSLHADRRRDASNPCINGICGITAAALQLPADRSLR